MRPRAHTEDLYGDRQTHCQLRSDRQGYRVGEEIHRFDLRQVEFRRDGHVRHRQDFRRRSRRFGRRRGHRLCNARRQARPYLRAECGSAQRQLGQGSCGQDCQVHETRRQDGHTAHFRHRLRRREGRRGSRSARRLCRGARRGVNRFGTGSALLHRQGQRGRHDVGFCRDGGLCVHVQGRGAFARFADVFGVHSKGIPRAQQAARI